MFRTIQRRIVIPFILLVLASLGGLGAYVSYSIKQPYQNELPSNITVPLAQVQASLSNLQWAILGTALLASVLAVLLALWITRSINRPLRKLTYFASELAQSEFSDAQISARMPAKMPAELERLTQALNRMAVQLRSQITAAEVERSTTSAVLQAVNDAVLLVDASGLVQMINPAAESMFAVEKEKVLKRSLAEGLRHHQLVELWKRSRESGETQTALLEISTERLFLQGIAKPMADALPGSTLLLFNNLTRQRYLETVRRDFVSNISHELRTPLASLKALTETLQAGALEDPPAARRFLQRMETEVDALTQMVAELLELTRIESGRVPLQLKPIRAVDLITSAVDRLRLQAERSRLSLYIHCSEDLPPVLADLPRLEQVIVNLLHNAIKFTPPGGEIHVAASMEESVEGNPPRIVFSVKDTGVGIAADDLLRIFERFYKTDRARSSSGTGLGLAIARHTVEAHQGRIWAESIEGQGSTFFFSLPVSQG